MQSNILIAFLMTLFAGLATGVGSLIALLFKNTNEKFLSVSLGFSAGVMVYVSFVEIYFKAQHSLTLSLGAQLGGIVTVISFFMGMLFIGIIDKLVPEQINPHEFGSDDNKIKLYKMGVFTALAVAIHNFPEGLATFVSALEDPALAIPIVVAIAIHNIPEGIAVSVPIYHSTGDKKKAFMFSFLSGLAEPIGALIGYVILMPFMSDTLMGVLFAMVSGIMVFISFDQLLPAAQKYGNHHLSLYGLISGMFVMAISLVLFM